MFYSRPLPNIWMEIPTDISPSMIVKQAKSGMAPLDSVTWHNAVSVVQLTLLYNIFEIFPCHTIQRHKEL